IFHEKTNAKFLPHHDRKSEKILSKKLQMKPQKASKKRRLLHPRERLQYSFSFIRAASSCYSNLLNILPKKSTK
ncbi:MAG: hypothetical protein K6G15_00600, partial [Desulfovibrio sp.]|nr:hypothetical protein [Desulfovibrio sp.]